MSMQNKQQPLCILKYTTLSIVSAGQCTVAILHCSAYGFWLCLAMGGITPRHINLLVPQMLV